MIRLNGIFGKKEAPMRPEGPEPDEAIFARRLRTAVSEPVEAPDHPAVRPSRPGAGQGTPVEEEFDFDAMEFDDLDPADNIFSDSREISSESEEAADPEPPQEPEPTDDERLADTVSAPVDAPQQSAAAHPAGEPAKEGATPSLDLSQLDLSAIDLSAAAAAGPAAVPAARRAGRVKTRLLGFDHAAVRPADPFAAAPAAAPPPEAEQSAAVTRFPVGWIVVTKGPGRGACFALGNGVSQIGRGADQAIALDFGDASISRTNHAAVAYDDEDNSFYLGHGGKANMVRLNGRPVISTEPLRHMDVIRIGETTLLFVALCGADFRWTEDAGPDLPG